MELKGRRGKNTIRELLNKPDARSSVEIICQYPPRQSVNYLLSFFYDKDERIRWRAISAFGRVVAMLADDQIESARVIMRRLMWNLNDESGGIGWGSPEAMGEITALHPRLADEFSVILRSYIRREENFLEHEMLQRGVLWGIGRLAEARPETLPETDSRLLPFLSSRDKYHRGFAAWALGNLRSRSSLSSLEPLTEDKSEISFFTDLVLKTIAVRDLARDAVAKL